MTIEERTQAGDEAHTPATGDERTWRVRPSIGVALAIYLGYLAVFFTTWAVNGVDYEHIGDTVRSTRLHYAMPTLLGCVFLVIVITALGWWRPTLFDKSRSGPAWAWLAPAAMFGLAIGTLLWIDRGPVTGELVLWSVLGGIGVGFGEEMITRGSMLVGLRTKYPETKVWLFSTLLFSALHVPNIFFGLPVSKMPGQVALTFIVGSMLYATRRLGGTLIVCMFLHGLWDSAAFLVHATDSKPFVAAVALYPVAIVCAWAVIRRTRGQRLPLG